MKRAALLLGMLLLAGQAWAANWYASDCAGATHYTFVTAANGEHLSRTTGCYNSASLSGCGATPGSSSTNPICPDPNGDGILDSIAYLQDGVAPDAVSGDTIYLCSGPCDGAGAAVTIGVNATAPNPASGHKCLSNTWFQPKVNNLTVTGYPGEGLVTFSGDKDGNNCQTAFTGGGQPGCTGSANEPDVLVGEANGHSGITFKNVGLKRAGVHWYCILDHGAPGWTFDNVTATESGWPVWNDTDGIASGPQGACTTSGTCQCGASGSSSGQDFGIYLTDQGTSKVTITNCHLSTTCGSAVRIITSPNSEQADGLLSFDINNNEIWNAVIGVEFWQAHNIRVADNYIHDTMRGIGPENSITYADIDHNRIECRGDWKAQLGYQCDSGIGLESGDGCQSWQHTAHHVRITRNKIVAKNTGTTRGRFRSPMYLEGPRCDTGHTTDQDPIGCPTPGSSSHPDCAFVSNPGNVVENNMIALGKLPDVSTDKPHYQRAGIGMYVYNPLVVQNNTIYGSTYGMVVDGAPSNPNGAVTIINNLIDTTTIAENSFGNARSSGIGITLMPAMVSQEANLTHNNLFSAAGANWAVRRCTTSSSNECTAFGTSCIYGSSFTPCLSSTTNTNHPSTFVNGAFDIDAVDIHLSPLDVMNRDTVTSGAAKDYDNSARPFGTFWDLGADESTGNLLADGDFESGAFGSGWTRDGGNCDIPMESFKASAAKSGAYGMELTSACTSPGLCIGDVPCDGIWQSVCGLSTGATATISGDYFTVNSPGSPLCPDTSCTRDEDCLVVGGDSTCAPQLQRCYCASGTTCPGPQVCTSWAGVFGDQSLGRKIRFIADFPSPTPDVELCGGVAVGTPGTWGHFTCSFTPPAATFKLRILMGSPGGPNFSLYLDNLILAQ